MNGSPFDNHNVKHKRMDYKQAGVDIKSGEELVDDIKPFVKATRTSGVLSEIGLFGGFFDAHFPDHEHPVLVASTDGVGTKLKVAVMAGIHDTVGQCLVNHCVNDILACGARPLFFLDYFATGRLERGVARDVIKGAAQACTENGAALLGGETAEMPSIYADGDYDMAGRIVGVVDKPKIINGANVRVGDVMIGLPSTGLHTNGFSLARAALFPTYSVDQYIDDLGSTIGHALLSVHKSYLHAIIPVLEAGLATGLSHITGGGIVGNTSRILPQGLGLEVSWGRWDVPPIFDIIRSAGNIDESEMRHVFNLGVGMIVVVRPDDVDTTLSLLAQHNPFIVGAIVAS